MRSSTKPYDVHFWVQSGHSSGQSPLLLLPDLPVATIKGVVKTPVIVACAGAARRLTFDYVAILPRHLEHVPLIARCIPDLRANRQLSLKNSSLGARCSPVPPGCRMC